MKFSSQTGKNHRSASSRLIAAVFLVCFLLVSLFSEGYILAHVGHVHDHDGAGGACTACIQIQNAQNTLKQPAMAVSGVVPPGEGAYAVAATVKTVYSDIAVPTPVSLKTRMNN